ncbi:CCA tRNA nucleotidyltransferase [Desulfomarina sp.]
MCKVKLHKLARLSAYYPDRLLQALGEAAGRDGIKLHVVGGTVRDILLAKHPGDLDIALAKGAISFVQTVIAILGGGSFVDLSGPEDEGARLVWRNIQVDVADYRKNVSSIEEDLLMRDFTVNSMAIPFAEFSADGAELNLLDPAGGLADLQKGVLRHCGAAFVDDPVRMVRAFRFQATMGFFPAEETMSAIEKNSALISRVAPERIRVELDMIFSSNKTAATLKDMHGTSLLERLLPELYRGKGVNQPRFHHLDVFDHNMLTLEMMEELIAFPETYFPAAGEILKTYLQGEHVVRGLKWAALLHDIGKPGTRRESEKETGRVTFYGHDEAGKKLFSAFAKRMRWSGRDTDFVASLISMHMHPFHLCNNIRTGGITKRAALKICKRAGGRLPALFLLAMADSLAGRGELKPENMEDEIAFLFEEVCREYRESIRPILKGPRLLTGTDLAERFGLTPGPIFSAILDGLEIAMVESEVKDRDSAISWVEGFLGNAGYVLSKKNKWTKTCVK